MSDHPIHDRHDISMERTAGIRLSPMMATPIICMTDTYTTCTATTSMNTGWTSPTTTPPAAHRPIAARDMSPGIATGAPVAIPQCHTATTSTTLSPSSALCPRRPLR